MNYGDFCRGPISYAITTSGMPNHTCKVALSGSYESDALDGFVEAGATGCNFREVPPHRWVAAIRFLFDLGTEIETVIELHGAQRLEIHATYVLRSRVTRRREP